jgi:hypothetical protein
MRTDHLIALLVADLKSVDRARVSRAPILASLIGAAAAFAAMLLALGPHPEVFAAQSLGFLSIKLLFTLSTVATAGAFLPQFARPGAEGHGFLLVVCLPFAAIGILAAVPLAATDWGGWSGMIFAKGWLTCLLYIPHFALAPFAAVVCGLRAGAPTELPQAGAAAGLVAGGLSATACAFSCPDESIPAVAVWYGATIVACASIGARLGPRLLQW